MSEPIMRDLPAQPQSGDAAEYPYGPRPAVLAEKELAWPGSAPLLVLPPAVQGPAIAAVLFGMVFAASNSLLCPLLEIVDPPPLGGLVLFVFVQIGAMLSQGGLLSTLLVFGRGPFWLRTACCWTAALLLWSCWAASILGLGVAGRPGWSGWRDVLSFCILSLPLVALAIQSPLWVARNYFGWRLKSTQASLAADRPLSIGDYLVGTVVVAISLACARGAKDADTNATEYWGAWAIVFAWFAVGSALSIIPALLAIFRLRDWRIALALLLVYGLVAGLAILAGIVAIFGRPGGTGGVWIMVGLVVIFVSLAAFLAGPMIAARMLGFELVLRRSQRGSSSSGVRTFS